MNDSDADQALFKLIWLVKGGSLLLRRNGLDTASVSHNGVDPEIDILDVDSAASLMPPINPLFMERMRRISRRFAELDMNVKVLVNGNLFLNMGSKGTIFRDIEGFAGMFMNRLTNIVKRIR